MYIGDMRVLYEAEWYGMSRMALLGEHMGRRHVLRGSDWGDACAAGRCMCCGETMRRRHLVTRPAGRRLYTHRLHTHRLYTQQALGEVACTHSASMQALGEAACTHSASMHLLGQQRRHVVYSAKHLLEYMPCRV
jgi:hypothetical protein